MIHPVFVLCIIVVFSLPLRSNSAVIASSIAKEGCAHTCGKVSVPYPYGIGDLKCAKNASFLLNCNETTNPPTLLLINVPVYDISLDDGILIGGIDSSYDCYNQAGRVRLFNQSLTLEYWQLTISSTRNKLTVLGCDSFALINDADGTFGSGCLAICNDQEKLEKDGSCSGFGCCQTSLPAHLKTLDITISTVNNHSDVLSFNPCGYAFVVDTKTYNISSINFTGYPTTIPNPHVALEWVVGKHGCEASDGPSGYSCGDHANCTYSESGDGYRCLCEPGFLGNPYLPQGCQDIDECKEPDKYPCQGTCKNTIGNYTCKCPLGMYGDGKVGCRGLHLWTIAAIIGAVSLSTITALLALFVCHKWRKEKYFKENGGMVLKHQRIRLFSEAELAKATNNYDAKRFLGEGGFGSVYKGVLADGILVAVKKAKEVDKARMNQEFQHEIGVVSQVNHKNVVKLLGLCLETKVPLMVYEFISNGTLFHHIHDKSSQLLRNWKTRLRIAAETALALDYLHSLADPPIIHGDVKSMNILLDDQYTAKVSDFGASVLISPDQTRVLATKIQGTFRYLDPEYLMTGNLSEKSDVYSFRVVLVELLTGEKPSSGCRGGKKRNIIQYFISSFENNCLSQVLNLEVEDDGEMEEIEAVADLVKRCLNPSGLKRPTMKEVAEELQRLKKLHENVWAQKNSEETERLLDIEESTYQAETYSLHSTFDIEQASSSSGFGI